MNWTEAEVAARGKAQPVAPRNKYGVAKPENRTYHGVLFASKLEMEYAMKLDLLVKAGVVKSYLWQVPYNLRISDKQVTKIIVDFLVLYADGRIVATEVKGVETKEWRVKWRLFRALYPELLTKVVKG